MVTINFCVLSAKVFVQKRIRSLIAVASTPFPHDHAPEHARQSEEDTFVDDDFPSKPNVSFASSNLIFVVVVFVVVVVVVILLKRRSGTAKDPRKDRSDRRADVVQNPSSERHDARA